jgi:Uma2 family endonuclease
MSPTLLEAPAAAEAAIEQHTPEELLQMPDGHRYELIDGKLVERNMGAEASEVAANVIRIVGHHVRGNKLGKVFATDCGYQIFPEAPNRVRYPDGSFIARGRLPGDRTPRGHVGIPPDLAVEVVSPNDTAEEVEAKRLDFLRAGTRLVWVIYPETRTVYVYRQAGGFSVLTQAEELSGEDVLPGFACRVAELFEEEGSTSG